MKYPTPNASHERRCHDCGNVAIHADRITPWVLCGKCGSQDTRATKSVPAYAPTIPREVADRLADTVAHLARDENTPAGLFVSLMAAVREYRKAVS